jgi:hypothetical protein
LELVALGDAEGVETFWTPSDEEQQRDPIMALWRLAVDARRQAHDAVVDSPRP